MSRNALLGLLVAAVIGVAAFVAIQDSQKGPFEKAGEQLDEAADDLSDAVENAD